MPFPYTLFLIVPEHMLHGSLTGSDHLTKYGLLWLETIFQVLDYGLSHHLSSENLYLDLLGI